MPTMQSTSLEALVERARQHRMAPEERRSQRISLIMGLRSHASTLTHTKVEELLDEQEGVRTVSLKNGAKAG